MNRNLLIGAFIAILIVTSYVVFNSGMTGQVTAQQKVKIGVVEHAAGLPYFVAIEKDYFEQEGINAEYSYFSSTKPLADALAAGQIDAGLVTYSLLFGAEARAPGEFQGALMVGEDTLHGAVPLLVPANSTISSISQLKRKKIGIAAPGLTPMVKIIFTKLDLNDVDLQDIDTALQVEVLASGSIGALFATEPQATTAVEQGIARVIERSPRARYLMDPFPAGALVVFKTTFVKEHGTTAQKIVNALKLGVDYIRTDEDDARKIMEKKLKLPRNVARKVPLYTFFKQSEITPEVKQRVQELADIMHEAGQLDKRINVDNLFYVP